MNPSPTRRGGCVHFDITYTYTRRRFDGIVCGACMDVHTPVFVHVKSLVFMQVEWLWHASEPRHYWG